MMDKNEEETVVEVRLRDDVAKKKKRRKKTNESGEERKTKSSKHSRRASKTKRQIKSPRNADKALEVPKKKKKRRTSRKHKTTKWKHLPQSAYAEIFSYFNLQDMKSVVAVCKEWKYLYYKYASVVDFRTCFRRFTCNSLSTNQIRNILLPFTNIEHLSLCSCKNVTNTTLIMLCNRFQHSLLSLDISECELIADTSIREIGSLKYLQFLSVSNCKSISSSGLQALLKMLPELRGLDISYNKYVTDDLLESLYNMKQLKKLNLSCTCTQGKFLALASTTITELYLNSCSYLRPKEFAGYIDYFENIKLLDLSYCSDNPADSFSIDDDDLGDDSSEDQFISRTVNDSIAFIAELKQLEVLILRGNYISSNSLAELSRSSNLRYLDLFSCNGFNITALHPLAEHPCLQYLDLSYCPNLQTYETVQFILLYFGHLQSVYLPTGQFFKDWKPPSSIEARVRDDTLSYDEEDEEEDEDDYSPDYQYQ